MNYIIDSLNHTFSGMKIHLIQTAVINEKKLMVVTCVDDLGNYYNFSTTYSNIYDDYTTNKLFHQMDSKQNDNIQKPSNLQIIDNIIELYNVDYITALAIKQIFTDHIKIFHPDATFDEKMSKLLIMSKIKINLDDIKTEISNILNYDKYYYKQK